MRAANITDIPQNTSTPNTRIVTPYIVVASDIKQKSPNSSQASLIQSGMSSPMRWENPFKIPHFQIKREQWIGCAEHWLNIVMEQIKLYNMINMAYSV